MRGEINSKDVAGAESTARGGGGGVGGEINSKDVAGGREKSKNKMDLVCDEVLSHAPCMHATRTGD